MELAGRILGPGHSALVIAEIGNNHDGSVHQAERLVDAAAEAGADAAKFQTHIAEAEMHPSTPTPPHFPEPRWEFTKRMQLSLDEHRHLKAYTEEKGLIFFSSPFSVEAVDLLEEVEVPLYKIASGEVTNPPLIEAIAATGKPVLLSSGMSGIPELEDAMEILERAGSDVLVMQCTSNYPCPPEKVNLRAMPALGERFGRPYGLSDHTPDIHTSIAAIALGASAIEKHYTLSKRLYGPDHHASLIPEELARLVDGVRQVEAALGSAEKERDPELDPARATFEKSIVAATAIAAGATIEREMLTTKRPGNGIPAVKLGEVVGRRAARTIDHNHILEVADLA
ncbi:MAG: N-acetylneuraminate synthase family protein [Gaiellaceae bacterium]